MTLVSWEKPHSNVTICWEFTWEMAFYLIKCFGNERFFCLFLGRWNGSCLPFNYFQAYKIKGTLSPNVIPILALKLTLKNRPKQKNLSLIIKCWWLSFFPDLFANLFGHQVFYLKLVMCKTPCSFLVYREAIQDVCPRCFNIVAFPGVRGSLTSLTGFRLHSPLGDPQMFTCTCSLPFLFSPCQTHTHHTWQRIASLSVGHLASFMAFSVLMVFLCWHLVLAHQ